MARRTYTWNAFETTLTGPLLIGSTQVQVATLPAGIQEPLYLVVDPDVPASREWIRVNTINGLVFENIVRGLVGSVGVPDEGVDHLAGATIRAVFTMQNLDDIFLDINDVEQGLIGPTGHIPDPGDPHAAAGYLKLSTGDERYIERAGDSMLGPLILAADPTDDLGTATKQYVDVVDDKVDAIDLDYEAHKLDPSAHHVKYTDSDAVAAMGAINANNALNHNRYADSEAVDAMGAIGDGNPLHHDRYTDAEAIAAVDSSGDYLPLTGGTISGTLVVTGRITSNTQFRTGSAEMDFASGQVQIRNLSSGVSLLVGSTAIASNQDGTISSGAGSFPWSTVYSNSLANASREVGMGELFDRIDDIIAWANGQAAGITALTP